ncbi:hypothetical protein DY000_02052854 [Brassica cretica]|uniref:Retrotransposon gag domain-containing protein n=1 Tax=Brassica cretica TaxID=69181 RepID=A0ABQ7A9K6_BRACR|nr:hypothetical protein DY000_02052854 [Brassica cretica]
MPRKFSFPSIKAYNGTTDPDNHVAQYRQRMLTVALPKGSREATMCKGFGSTLTGPALQWYINLPSRSIAEEKHLERQARPRSRQAKTPAPRDGQNKFHSQGAGESPHSSSRRPGHLAHCSELPCKKDTGG